MNKRKSPSLSASSQFGLTLIELMVSMAVGMLIVLLVSQVFFGARRSIANTSDLALAQEGGRFGIDTMLRHVRLAGYQQENGRAAFSSTLANCGAGSDAAQAICGVNDTGSPLTDEIRVRFYGAAAPAGGADGATLDCQGAALGAGDIVEERWSVVTVQMNPSDTTTARPTLVCDLYKQGGGAIPAARTARVPIVYNVDRLQILYGEDTDADGAPDMWRPANLANMSRVVAVQVAVVMLGENRNAGGTGAAAEVFRMFGASYPATSDAGAIYSAPADNRFRKLYNATVSLRNRG
ncbi:PilW family protein [Niveibacterium sp.]|uniref:PilW family protein n=1 Tax=Niveibacterium sp. TaxID=2017444 RepID=UPI0035AF195A